MFVSVDGKAKEVIDIFAGGSDGKAHRITEAFGSVNGTAKRIYTIDKEQNAFNQFTWAEIKQLANEGQLLEHFNRFDKVVIKLKEPLRQTVFNVPLVQNEIMFQIAEITETKMRLMCPRASALAGESDIPDNIKKNYLSLVPYAWGLTAAYTRLKALDNAFPDDFRDVLSVVARPLISITKHPITGYDVYTYDEDMRVTQVSDDIFKKGNGFDASDPECWIPIIEQSYYPTTVGEFTYYLTIPRELDTYETRRRLIGNCFGCLSFFDYVGKRVEISYNVFENRIKRSYTDSPYASCYFSKGITDNAGYKAYMNSGVFETDYTYNLPITFGLFPEVVIEAD